MQGTLGPIGRSDCQLAFPPASGHREYSKSLCWIAAELAHCIRASGKFRTPQWDHVCFEQKGNVTDSNDLLTV